MAWTNQHKGKESSHHPRNMGPVCWSKTSMNILGAMMKPNESLMKNTWKPCNMLHKGWSPDERQGRQKYEEYSSSPRDKFMPETGARVKRLRLTHHHLEESPWELRRITPSTRTEYHCLGSFKDESSSGHQEYTRRCKKVNFLKILQMWP